MVEEPGTVIIIKGDDSAGELAGNLKQSLTLPGTMLTIIVINLNLFICIIEMNRSVLQCRCENQVR